MQIADDSLTQDYQHQDGRPSYGNLQPLRQQTMPRWKRVMHSMDIFAFLPTPRTYPVSTKRSLIGSAVLFILFLSYMIYSFIDFLLHNVPKVTQFSQQDPFLSDTQAPEIAIAFLYGEPFVEQINDPSMFTITSQEVTKFSDPSKQEIKKEIPLISCKPDWIPANASPFDFWCPSIPFIMRGLLYSSEEFIYPRFQIDFCKYLDPNAGCKTEDEIKRKTAGGRIFLYVKNEASNLNYVTGAETDVIPYQTYQYFLVPSLYNRAEIVFQKEQVTITGNYFTSFFTKEKEYMSVNKQLLYVSDVTPNQGTAIYKGFQIWLRLDSEVKMVQVVKVTIVDVISKWGAFWGVLFAGFAFYFLRFNSQRFYNKNPEWAAFDEKK